MYRKFYSFQCYIPQTSLLLLMPYMKPVEHVTRNLSFKIK